MQLPAQKVADGAFSVGVVAFGLSLAELTAYLQLAALTVSIIAGCVSVYFHFRKRK